MPGDPNCINYEKAYEGWFTANDTQWFEGLSRDTSFYTFFELDEESE